MSIIIFNAKPKAKEKLIQARGVKPPKPIEWEARRTLDRFMQPVYAELEKWVGNFLIELDKNRITARRAADELRYYQYTFDDYARRLSDNIAENWVSAVDQENKKRTQRNIGNRLGVDVYAILNEEAVRDTLDIMLVESAELIRTIPHDLVGQVARRVIQYYKGEPMPEGRSLYRQIQEEFHISADRAKVIARDQTSKLNGNLNAVRQMDLGIEEYIWQTARDRRVVGNPAGLYPKGNRMHGNHYERQGHVFEWTKPPEDGHPGQAIQCRCYADPLIRMDRLRAKWV